MEPNYPEPPRPLFTIVSKPIINAVKRLVSKTSSREIILLPESVANQSYSERFIFSEDRQKAVVKIQELKHYYSTSLPKFYIF
jgi:hypothetical protein